LVKIRNLAIVCLAALLLVYCGTTLLTLVYAPSNADESVVLSPRLLSKNSGTRPGFIALGDPIVDPRPH